MFIEGSSLSSRKQSPRAPNQASGTPALQGYINQQQISSSSTAVSGQANSTNHQILTGETQLGISGAFYSPRTSSVIQGFSKPINPLPLSPRMKNVNNPETMSPRLTESVQKAPPQTAEPPKRSSGSKAHQYHKSQSESVADRVLAALTQSQEKMPSMVDQLEQEEEGEATNLYSYTFDAKVDEEQPLREESDDERDQKEIEDLDYCDQYYMDNPKQEGEEDIPLPNEEDGNIEGDPEYFGEDTTVSSPITVLTQNQQKPKVIDPKSPISVPRLSIPQQTQTKQDSPSSGTLPVNPANVREVRYTLYGENLEMTLRLLSCQKNINLIDKKDPKSRRMFITATHYKPIKEQQSGADLDKPEKAQKLIVPDGQGGPTKKLINLIENVEIYHPKQLFTTQVIDQSSRSFALGKMRKNMDTIQCLGLRYCGLDDYRAALIVDLIKPLKRKKRFSFLNPDNLPIIVSHIDGILPNVNGGGLRQLNQEFDQNLNRIINQRLNRIKILKPQIGSGGKGYQSMYYSSVKQQNSFSQNLKSSKGPYNQQTINSNQPQQQQMNGSRRGTTQGGNLPEHLVEPYKRFRYNFHYWLKNFKYNEDGTFQFIINENNIQTGQVQQKTQAQVDAASKIPHSLPHKEQSPPPVIEMKGPSIVGLTQDPLGKSKPMPPQELAVTNSAESPHKRTGTSIPTGYSNHVKLVNSKLTQSLEDKQSLLQEIPNLASLEQFNQTSKSKAQSFYFYRELFRFGPSRCHKPDP